MHAAFDRADAVYKAIEAFRVLVVVLEAQLNFNAVCFIPEEYRLMNHASVFVDVTNKGLDATFKAVALGNAFGGTCVHDVDVEPSVQERQLAHSISDCGVIEIDDIEDFKIWLETHMGAATASFTLVFHGPDGSAAFETLEPGVSSAPDFDFQPFAEGVDDRRTNTVQSTRHLVGAVVELGARM